MTIYDADYLLENPENNKTAVLDPVAVDQQEPIQAENEAQEEAIQEPVAQEKLSDKEINFRAMREELARLKEEKMRLAEEFEQIKRSQNVRREPEAPRKRSIDEINNDDIVTGAHLKKALAEREEEYRIALGELQVKSKYADYDEVTSKYGVPLIQNDPELAQGLLAANNKAAYLYKIGKMARDAEQREIAQEAVRQAQPEVQKAQRIVENSRKPGTLSNAVGGAGNLSKADYFASMSDADFYSMVRKNLGES